MDLHRHQESVDDDGHEQVGGKQVLLTANGVTYRTFANEEGELRFFGTPSGRLQLGRRGARGIDISTYHGPDVGFSFLDIDDRSRATRGIYDATWKQL